LTPAVALEPRPGARSRTWAWSLLAVLAALLTLAGFARAFLRPQPPPVMGQVPPFTLVDTDGRTVTRDDLRGRAWVADFIFTRCAGACPVMTARLGALRAQVPDDVVFVSLTVDPVHDTPEVLGRYAQRAGAGPHWRFLGGTREALYALAIGGFKLGVEEVPPERQSGGDGPFLHSSHFVLVDGGAAIRGYYDSTDEEALARLKRDVAAVRSEPGSRP
jgi:protein SCO1/2